MTHNNNPTPKDFDAEVDEALEVANTPTETPLYEALKAGIVPPYPGNKEDAVEAARERLRHNLTEAAEARMKAREINRKISEIDKATTRLSVARDANTHYSLVAFFPLGGATIALVALLVLGDDAGDWLLGTAFGLSTASVLTTLGQQLIQKSFTKPYYAAVKALRKKN